MTYVDAAVLELVERLCRRFQLLTGRTNVWLAVQLTNVSIIVYFVWAGAYFWISDLATRIGLGLFCGVLLYGLTQTVFKVPVEMYEHNAYRRVAKGLRNPRRVRDALLRILFLMLSLILFGPMLFVFVTLRFRIVLLTYSLIGLTTVLLYVLACDPLPPCAGRLTEWLRGLAGARTPVRPSPASKSCNRADVGQSTPENGWGISLGRRGAREKFIRIDADGTRHITFVRWVTGR
jgi:hypothetical protein